MSMIKATIIFLVLMFNSADAATTSAKGCFMDSPQLLATCAVFRIDMLFGMETSKAGPVCKIADEFLTCASGFAANCPVGNTLSGALNDMRIMIDECCHDPKSGNSYCMPGGAFMPVKETCFPTGSTVMLAEGKRTTVEQLQIGDVIKVMGNDGRVVDSEVIMFTDRDEHVRDEYIELRTQTGHSLRVSSAHLVALQLNGSATFKHASEMKIGDVMFVNADQQRLTPSPVVSVTKQTLRGAFAPITMEGSLLVDDVAASCYAVVSEHWIGHMAFSPLRALHSATRGLFGQVAFNRQEKGIHWVVSAMWSLTETLLPSVLVR